MSRVKTPKGNDGRGIPNRAYSNFRAFTLLELVVVLAITGLLLGFAALTIGDGGRRGAMEREAERLKALCELAAQKAILQAQEIGVLFDERGYAFLVFADDQWLPPDGDGVLRRRSLPEGLRLLVATEGSRLFFGQSSAREFTPQVIFFSSGEISPFEILLADEHAVDSFRLSGAPDGTLELQKESAGHWCCDERIAK